MARKPKVKEEAAPSEYVLQKQREAVQKAVRSGTPSPSRLLDKLTQGQRAYLVEAHLTEKSAVLEQAVAAEYENARELARKFLKPSTPYGACRIRCFWKMWNPEIDAYGYVRLLDHWATRRNGGLVFRDNAMSKDEVMRA